MGDGCAKEKKKGRGGEATRSASLMSLNAGSSLGKEEAA